MDTIITFFSSLEKHPLLRFSFLIGGMLIFWIIENSQQEYDAKKCLETVINQVGVQKKKDEEIAIDDDLEFDEL